MTTATRTKTEVREAWTAADAGTHYAGKRWSSERRRLRDAQRLAGLVERHAPGLLQRGTWLDAACGAGRLASAWEPAPERYVGVDTSGAMLGRHPLPGRVLRADAFALPFENEAFRLVVACRFLHHLVAQQDLMRATAELCRVAGEYVAVTFWDARSLADWQNPKRGDAPGDPRIARSADELIGAFDIAGADVVDIRHSFRFVSRQAYALVRIR